jgi:glutaredoxin
MAKDFFANNHVDFEEFDVMTDINRRQEMIEKSGQMGVPVIIIDGQVMVGFDEAHMKSLLGL